MCGHGKKEEESFDARIGLYGWHRLDVNEKLEPGPQMASFASAKLDRQLWENSNLVGNKMEASGLWFSSLHVSSTSSSSSGKSNAMIKVERDTNYEILWEDLITKQQIGQGSCGSVYHGLWDCISIEGAYTDDSSNSKTWYFGLPVDIGKLMVFES